MYRDPKGCVWKGIEGKSRVEGETFQEKEWDYWEK